MQRILILAGVIISGMLGSAALDSSSAFAANEAPNQSSATRAETPKIPPALKQYKGRRIAQTMHYLGAPWLVRESRQREEDCATLIENLAIEPGQVVCDMGCGNGFYTLKFAELVGDAGQVLAVDIQPEMLSMLVEAARTQELKNIKPLLGTVIDPRLPPESVDLIVCVDVYHEFSHPVHMLRAMREALKPEGRLALVEFRLEDASVPIKREHKMSKQQIYRELIPNGFKVIDEFDGLPWQHVIYLARDDSPLESKLPESAKPAASARPKAD